MKHRLNSFTTTGFLVIVIFINNINIRVKLIPVILLLPVTIIIGDLGSCRQEIIDAGFKPWELMLFPLGLGLLLFALTPKHMISKFLRMAAILAAIFFMFRFFLPSGRVHIIIFTAFRFCSGFSAVCAFCLFYFELNKPEKVFGIALFLLFYGLYYIFRKTWLSPVLMAMYLVLVFYCAAYIRQSKLLEDKQSDDPQVQPIPESQIILSESDTIGIKDQYKLTSREQEVFTMLLGGKAPKEIAYTLKISYPTVNFHIANLYRKLGIQSRTELFVKFMK